MSSQGQEIRPLRNVVALDGLIERVEARGVYQPGMACFSGPSGWGKTFAAVFGQRAHGAIHVECCDFWTRKSLCTAILRELSARPARTIPEMFDQILQELGRSGRPLIIDEADHLLRQNMIEMVRRMHDDTQCAVILVGEEALPERLKGIERVHSRIFDWVQAQPADLEDAHTLAPMYAAGITVDEALIARIHTESRGSIRRICVNLGRAAEAARTLGRSDIDLTLWGDRSFFTGEPPKMRSNLS